MKKKALMVLLVVAVSLIFTVLLAGTWEYSSEKGHKVKNPWAGQWACAMDSSHAEPMVISLQQLTISRKGTYTGIVKTAIASDTGDDFLLDCTGNGTLTEVREGYATLEGTGVCDLYPDIEADSVADCVGMLKGKNGYLEMRCIDLTQEPDGQEILFLNICKRQDVRR
ncbi:MAG: hypothetical protein GY762_21205 [Proteobacteria bacterium]|nr:hypothetical protein [Pseudomonadota bacterium]